MIESSPTGWRFVCYEMHEVFSHMHVSYAVISSLNVKDMPDRMLCVYKSAATSTLITT